MTTVFYTLSYGRDIEQPLKKETCQLNTFQTGSTKYMGKLWVVDAC